MTSAHAPALIALWTYWLLAGLGSWALAPLAYFWRFALIASVDSLAMLSDRALIAVKDLVALVLSYGTYCSLALCPRLRSYCSSDLVALLFGGSGGSGIRSDSGISALVTGVTALALEWLWIWHLCLCGTHRL
jgi:hypothetical protein